jgi:L-lactate dehydrogenase (cytochrome)
MFTVDAAAHSKRTLDQRVKGATNITAPPSNAEKKKEGEKKGPVGVAQAISGYQDDKLVWDDVAFIRKNSKLPILIKGSHSAHKGNNMRA